MSVLVKGKTVRIERNECRSIEIESSRNLICNCDSESRSILSVIYFEVFVYFILFTIFLTNSRRKEIIVEISFFVVKREKVKF